MSLASPSLWLVVLCVVGSLACSGAAGPTPDPMREAARERCRQKSSMVGAPCEVVEGPSFSVGPVAFVVHDVSRIEGEFGVPGEVLHQALVLDLEVHNQGTDVVRRPALGFQDLSGRFSANTSANERPVLAQAGPGYDETFLVPRLDPGRRARMLWVFPVHPDVETGLVSVLHRLPRDAGTRQRAGAVALAVVPIDAR